MANTKTVKHFSQYLIAILGGGLLLAITIFMGIIPYIKNQQRPAYLDINIQPRNAIVEINGESYRSAVYELEPGQYTAIVRLNDLPPETINLNLEKAKTLGVYLHWTKTKGWQYLTADELRHYNAIADIMPLTISTCGTPATRTNCDAITVKYDSAPTCQYDKCLLITGRQANLNPNLLDLLKAKLTEHGYDLEDYQYLYDKNSNL